MLSIYFEQLASSSKYADAQESPVQRFEPPPSTPQMLLDFRTFPNLAGLYINFKNDSRRQHQHQHQQSLPPLENYCRLCERLKSACKILPCSHRFCLDCLRPIVPDSSLTLTCPICDDTSVIPWQGLDDLPEKVEDRRQNLSSAIDVSNRKIADDVMTSRRCEQCEKSDAHCFCASCQLALCLNCRQSSNDDDDDRGSHLGHMIVPLDQSKTIGDHFDQSATNIGSQSESSSPMGATGVEILASPLLKAKLLDLQKMRSTCQSFSDTLSQRSMEEVKKIDDSFAKLLSLLAERKQLLINQCQQISREQMESIHKTCDQISEIEHSLRTNSQASNSQANSENACQQFEVVENKLRNLLGNLSAPTTTTNGENDLASYCGESSVSDTVSPHHHHHHHDEFPRYLNVNEKQMENLICKLGRVAQEKHVPVKICVKDAGNDERWKICCLNARTTITCQSLNYAGQQVDIDDGALEAYITSDFGKRLTANVRVNRSTASSSSSSSSGSVVGQGSFQLTFTLRQEGLFHLHVRLCGQPVDGSPVTLKCVSETEYSVDHCNVHSRSRWGGGGHRSSVGSAGSKQVTMTRTASKSPPVTSSSKHSLSTTPLSDDDLVAKIGVRGFGLGQLTNPQCPCLTLDNKLVVTDSNNQCVQVFNNIMDGGGGECVLKFGVKGRQAGHVLRPTGLLTLPNGQLLMADYDNRWVSVFEPDGKYLGRFGAGSLLGPKGLAVDQNGSHVIVVDNKASSVLVYDWPKFKLVKKFGTRGDKPHQLAGPHYVGVTRDDRLYVTDFHHHCVKVYDMRGQFLFAFGSHGTGNGQFNAPTGIAIDSNQNVLVADWGNNRIQVFDTNGSFLTFVNASSSHMFGPQGLCIVDGKNQVAVADSGNHCVKIYRYLA